MPICRRAIAGELPSGATLLGALQHQLLSRVAIELCNARGDDFDLDGWPAGYYFLLAGDLERARASLHAALARRRRARTLYLLGNVADGAGHSECARASYLAATTLDPYDPAFTTVCDPAVRELPDIARYELDIAEHPGAWSAAVGMVTGVFRPAMRSSIDRQDRSGLGYRPGWTVAACDPRWTAFMSCRAFLHCLDVAESADPDPKRIIAARREMKKLQPALFSLYLEHRSSGSQHASR